MMSLKEAKQILKSITVSNHSARSAEEAMLAKINTSKKAGLYRKQGGVHFDFVNGHCAWVSVYNCGGRSFYLLTERGEKIYSGFDSYACACMLFKLDVAHRTIDNFLDCAK